MGEVIILQDNEYCVTAQYCSWPDQRVIGTHLLGKFKVAVWSMLLPLHRARQAVSPFPISVLSYANQLVANCSFTFLSPDTDFYQHSSHEESALINIFLRAQTQTRLFSLSRLPHRLLCHKHLPVFPHAELSFLHAVLRTQPSHTAFFWEPRFHCTDSSFLFFLSFFFLAFRGMCFWLLFSAFIDVYI